MTDYREILRLKSLGLNHSQIAESTGASRTTIISVLQKATETGLSYQGASELTDKEVKNMLFPSVESKISYTMPDFEWIHKEMGKSGVTLQLLWFEYCDKCRAAEEIPYQLTQFKKYYIHRNPTTKIYSLSYSPIMIKSQMIPPMFPTKTSLDLLAVQTITTREVRDNVR